MDMHALVARVPGEGHAPELAKSGALVNEGRHMSRVRGKKEEKRGGICSSGRAPGNSPVAEPSVVVGTCVAARPSENEERDS